MIRRFLLILLVLVLFVGAVFAIFSWRAGIAPIEPPARASFEAATIERGAYLAALGDCVACHTAPGGRAYAGGFPLRTQFGTIYGTNITPDPETGIGRWSLEAFTRAVREGVARDGRQLYPVFPYDHFTLLGDDDIRALYAFIMTREPVRAETPANEVYFPINFRSLIAGWKILFFRPAAFRSDTAQSDEWNRGAYLVQGLAHCGACHTPRNLLGAEKRKMPLAGGEAEGWHAPAIDAQSRAPVPWTEESLYRYLRSGADARHETAAGPMTPVVHNLGSVPESEVRAIAVYIASVMGAPDLERQRRAQAAMARAAEAEGAPEPHAPGDGALRTGAALYAGSCAQCHGSASRNPGAPSSEALHLALSSSASLPAPSNLIRIVLQGLAPADGDAGAFMPGFSGAYTDAQVAAIAAYVRATCTDRPEWRNLEREVRKVRAQLAKEAR
ncbi:MAG TPA: cytochrome c [Burkholderiales bacterium]|nr:cytochrome c [Burkholderiales bacterium]